MTAETTNWKFI